MREVIGKFPVLNGDNSVFVEHFNVFRGGERRGEREGPLAGI
jgi:hypothetical protein